MVIENMDDLDPMATPTTNDVSFAEWLESWN